MTGAAIGTADTFFTAFLRLYNVSGRAADYKHDYSDYDYIYKLHFYLLNCNCFFFLAFLKLLLGLEALLISYGYKRNGSHRKSYDTPTENGHPYTVKA